MAILDQLQVMKCSGGIRQWGGETSSTISSAMMSNRRKMNIMPANFSASVHNTLAHMCEARKNDTRRHSRIYEVGSRARKGIITSAYHLHQYRHVQQPLLSCFHSSRHRQSCSWSRGSLSLTSPLTSLSPISSRCFATRITPTSSSSSSSSTQQQDNTTTSNETLDTTTYDQSRHISSSTSSSEPPASASTSATTTTTTTTALHFQDAVFRLQRFWSSNNVLNCSVLLPHSSEVGAGTMNPHTFLRVLGPEDWNVCYVEPSIRPDDARYGINPNRVHKHTQFQVILKNNKIDMSKTSPLELFLGSLESLGIDTSEHDVRFVEDNWASPVLGAWGLGWEVWLDGMEVTQFTYFQQSGGVSCDPVSVEITYGLERIMMAMQRVKHVKDVQYSDGLTYGELNMQAEYEMSCYSLDEADVEQQRERFELYSREAKQMIDLRLPIPAYDHVLKASHAFNVMDARGSVGVSERQKLFAEMRNLTRRVSELWMERRKELGWPLLNRQDNDEDGTKKDRGKSTSKGDGIVNNDSVKNIDNNNDDKIDSYGKADFVLEIGSEELPADYVSDGITQLSSSFPALLEKLRLDHDGPVHVDGTPRRLVVRVSGLVTRQPDVTDRVRGPPLRAAFDENDNPTRAAEGFAKKNQIQVDDLDKDGEYVWATVKRVGRKTTQVLGDELSALISSMKWKKTMRWQQGDAMWPRPLRWLLAVHGEDHIPFTAMDVTSGKSTRTMRRRRHTIDDVMNVELDVANVDSVSSYRKIIDSEKIVLSQDDRRNTIWTMSEELVSRSGISGATIPASLRTKGDLLDEVTNLVESPTPLIGKFDEKFLELPREVLETVMKKHQRYFPVVAQGGSALKPLFVIVANGQCNAETVIAGNEAVLRARYEDARFFFESDVKTPLMDLRPKLKGIMFQEKLGTMLDKAVRTEKLTSKVVSALQAQVHDDEELTMLKDIVQKAAPLMYTDLATAMVMEFTNLAGTMGRHYALIQGNSLQVSDAIFESVLPRQAGDKLPQTLSGCVLSIASRLDSLVGLFAAGCIPSASADPYGLRRIAYGLVETIIDSDLALDVCDLMRHAADGQPIDVSDSTLDEATLFLQRRLEQYLLDKQYDVELIRAVLAEQGNKPALAMKSVTELSSVISDDSFKKFIAAIARPSRIVKAYMEKAGTEATTTVMEHDIDESLLNEKEEIALWEEYKKVKALIRNSTSTSEVIGHAFHLVDTINNFFDKVFVMADDVKVRDNRLAMLWKVANITKGYIDLSHLPGF